jgi:hypothetical protein
MMMMKYYHVALVVVEKKRKNQLILVNYDDKMTMACECVITMLLLSWFWFALVHTIVRPIGGLAYTEWYCNLAKSNCAIGM